MKLLKIEDLSEKSLAKIDDLLSKSMVPWSLVPHHETTTGTVILHDCHGNSIADLQTAGDPNPCDQLIALAPRLIRMLLDEVRACRTDLDEPAAPVEIIINCPACGSRHIDEGEFATKRHHTHSCQVCGHTWRPARVATVGVRFLPGFKNADPPPADWEASYLDGHRAAWRHMLGHAMSVLAIGPITAPNLQAELEDVRQVLVGIARSFGDEVPSELHLVDVIQRYVQPRLPDPEEAEEAPLDAPVSFRPSEMMRAAAPATPVDAFEMNDERARWVRALRAAGCTWGRIAELYCEVTGVEMVAGSQGGAELCTTAALLLGDDPSEEPWN